MNNFLFFPRALAAIFFDIAFAVTSGLTLTRLWLRTDAVPQVDRRLLRGSLLGSAIMPIALVTQAWLLTATMLGSSVRSSVRDQLPFVMTQTHAGKALLSSGLVAVVFLLVTSLRRAPQSRDNMLLPIGLLTVLAATRAAAGHAAADGDFTLSEFVQLVHLVAMAIWSGGVIAAGYFVMPAMVRANQAEGIAKFMRKLSSTFTVALPLIVLSGIYNSIRGLGGSIAPLIGTQWGYLLDLKIALVCVAVSLGTLSRIILRGSALSNTQASRLSLAIKIEATVMLLILAISACLANSQPANSL